MIRSKLEIYIDILRVLAYRSPSKLTQIMRKANVNCRVLKECLVFLVEQNLVEERIVSKDKVVYAITKRGITVIGCFKELKQALHITEDATNKSADSLLIF